MTRIIGGAAGGRRLRTPRGEQTRPTSERVREALFSALESSLGSLSGRRFLDLYAGSGAVGLEAASRGASAVTLVEREARAAALISENARALGLTARVVRSPVARFLTRDAGADPPYDVVFCDPPYSLPEAQVHEDLAALASLGWLVDGACAVLERSSRSGEATWPSGYVPERVRRYGETSLRFATWQRPVGYLHDEPDEAPAASPGVPEEEA